MKEKRYKQFKERNSRFFGVIDGESQMLNGQEPMEKN